MSFIKFAPCWAGIVALAMAGCSPSTKPPPAPEPSGVPPEPAPPRPAATAPDWPQWRYDAARSAAAPFDLPDELYLHWTRAYGPRTQVWDDPLNHDLMTYDRVFEPVVLGARLFLGFNDRDKVVALDLDTGRELWTFFTDGPVRLPPAAWRDKVFFASDDGWLYAVRADDGTLAWRFRGAPSDRKALGNRRVVSAWPARGGPVVRDGRVYFAASIWPFMGTFIYALDAETGRVMWVNDGTGAQFVKQPHSAPAFAGVAPQGALVATRDFLLVPGGRSVPAAFERATGRFVHFQIEDSGKGNGGSFVAATDSEYFVHTRRRGTRAYDLKSGRKSTFTVNEPVLTTNRYFASQDGSFLQAAVTEAEQKLAAARLAESDALYDLAKAEDEGSRTKYRTATNALASARRKVARAEKELATALQARGTNYAGPVIQALGLDRKVRWELPADGTADLIKVGRRLYAAGTNGLLAVEVPATTNTPPRLAWTQPVEGQVMRLLAARDRLIAVTLDGRILCYGPAPRTPTTWREEFAASAPPAGVLAQARALVQQADARQGYALCYGVGDGQLLEALAAESGLHIVGVDPDEAVIEKLRRRLDAAGRYGTRIALHVGSPLSFQAPSYIANLVLVGGSLAARLTDRATLEAVYAPVRPYGGALWVSAEGADAAALAAQITAAGLAQARVQVGDRGVAVVRDGPLPGSADWTHQYGDVANSLKSDDRLVRLPLGVLWFGGPTHMDVLPRHGHGPSEQVVEGRLFIEGMNSLSARDVYTGRVLWKAEFDDLGTYGVYFDRTYTNTPLSTAYNQKHIPGANARGANFVATPDAVYLVVSNRCLVLDPRTGARLRTIEMPTREGEAEAPQWGYLGVYENVLLAGTGFGHYSIRFGLSSNPAPSIVDLSGSRGLAAFDRHTGELLWRADARHSFIHNGIVAGGGRVYCLDKLPRSVEDRFRRRGRSAPSDYRIAALDARTGSLLWEVQTNIFGTWLAYSKKHDLLVQAGASGTDRLKDEAERGLVVYRAADGSVQWQKLEVKYTGPCILHTDFILTTPTAYKTNAGAYSLLDGAPLKVTNPLTDEAEPVRIYRTYGCNYPVACEHLLTFRSGAAGFYDLETHSGTGNLGGFKSGCSANLIAAGGVLNAPDYTRTCSCPYQNQTSLALIHMPELELWTYNQFSADAKDGRRIKRLGVNFGAPGDRLANNGTLWLEYPPVGGSSARLWITIQGARTNFYRHHSSHFQGEGPAWVMASGVSDAETIFIGPETRKPLPAAPAPKKSSEDEDEDEDEDTNGNGATNAIAAATPAPRPSSRRATQTEDAYKSALPPAPYTVRLHFAEPDDLRPGERVFDVSLQDRLLVQGLDIVAQTGGPRRGLIKEFNGVLVKGQLAIGLARAKESKYGPILCGVEMTLEEGPTADAAVGGK